MHFTSIHSFIHISVCSQISRLNMLCVTSLSLGVCLSKEGSERYCLSLATSVINEDCIQQLPASQPLATNAQKLLLQISNMTQ